MTYSVPSGTNYLKNAVTALCPNFSEIRNHLSRRVSRITILTAASSSLAKPWNDVCNKKQSSCLAFTPLGFKQQHSSFLLGTYRLSSATWFWWGVGCPFSNPGIGPRLGLANQRTNRPQSVSIVGCQWWTRTPASLGQVVGGSKRMGCISVVRVNSHTWV